MRWFRGVLAVLAVAASAACERFTGHNADPVPAAARADAAPAPLDDPQSFAGQSYAEFIAAHETRFGAEALNLSGEDAARLRSAMAVSAGVLEQGGGAEALVFRGCAAGGCSDGSAVMAVDAATGATFVGVSDGYGKDILAPNERLEALLRLNAPTRDWAGAAAPQSVPVDAPRP